MRILQVCPRYFPNIGGVEEHVRNISERLIKTHEVIVATTDSTGRLPENEIINGVHVKRFKSWAPNGSFFFSNPLDKFLKVNSNTFDVVHAHSYHAFPSLYAVNQKQKNLFFFTPHYHGTGHEFLRALLHKPYRWYGRKIFSKADKIICVSEYERKLVLQHFKVSDERIITIPNGVNLLDFNLSRKLDKNIIKILYVGRLEKYKGIQYLIKAVKMIDYPARLVIVGQGSYKNQLFRLTKKLGLLNYVSFLENLSRRELLEQYYSSNVFAILSKHEAFGIAVAESLAAGTPCVVADTSALSAWIDDKNCFGIKNPSEIKALSSLILSVMYNHVDVQNILDWDQVVHNLEELYNSN